MAPYRLQGFKATDATVLEQCAANNWQDGATCVAVWVVGDMALVANIGDAKCVLARISDKVSAGAAPLAGCSGRTQGA